MLLGQKERNYCQCKTFHLAGTPNTLYSNKSGRGTDRLYTGHTKSFLLLTLFIQDHLQLLSLIGLPTLLSETCNRGKLEATYHTFPSSRARCPYRGMNTAFGKHYDQPEMEFGNVENNRLVKEEKTQTCKLKMF